jgi:hypothetical protein
MAFSTLTIATESKKGTAFPKGRSFSVHLLGYLTADALWTPGGDGSADLPMGPAQLAS